jgi:hypothetical protein
VRDVAHGTQVRVRGSRETAGCPVTACHCLPLLLSVENVTTKPTDRHTVRRRALRGEREARLAGKDRTGPGARGQIRLYGRCNIKQSGAWPYCSVACQSTPRGTAPAGAASPCDWLTSPLCVLLLVPPSVALPATKPAKNARPGPRFCQEGWGRTKRAMGPRVRGAEGRETLLSLITWPFLFLFLHTPLPHCCPAVMRAALQLCHVYAALNLNGGHDGAVVRRAGRRPICRVKETTMC